MIDLETMLLDCYQLTKSDELVHEVILKIKPEWAFFQGHFPEMPVLPAYGITEINLHLINKALNSVPPVKLKTLKNMRMKSPIQPGDTVKIMIQKDPAEMNTFNLQWFLTITGARVLVTTEIETTI